MDARGLLLRVGVGLQLSAVAACGSTLPGEWLPIESAGVGVEQAGRSAAGSGAIGEAGFGVMPAGRGGVAGRASAGTGAVAGTTAGRGARKQDRDADGYDVAIDCNDFDAKIFPGAPDACCDRIDSDCDGIDGTPPCNCFDLDGDGYSSDQMGPYWDCNDRDPAVHPFAVEDCNDGRDNDCNGAADRDDKACVLLSDHDGDGFPYGSDCNDFDPNIHPKAPELCDRIDNDCDGVVDPAPCPASVDLDGDGIAQDRDCNDWDAHIYPGAPESCCDAIDSNCDGNDDPLDMKCSCYDGDGDGYLVGPVDGKLADCNDQVRNVHPGAPENCTDGVDNDCDRRIDRNDTDCYVYVL